MRVCHYTRTRGNQYTYEIDYDQGEYLIRRDNVIKRSVPDATIIALNEHEATPDLMLKTAIADIESLNGMDE